MRARITQDIKDSMKSGNKARLSTLRLITAAIMEVLDTTIVNVALPQMAGNLGATLEEIGWVLTGYILSNVVVLPLTAFLTETFGRRNYLTFSIILFVVASFLCGTSTSLTEIVVWRIVQGAGGAALLSTAQATIRQIFPSAIVAPSLVPGGTDSRHYQPLADGVYRFSPQRTGPEDRARYHGTNERLSVENFAECVRFYAQLVKNSDGL